MVVTLVSMKISIQMTFPEGGERDSETKFIDKDLRILAKRSALNFGKMQMRTREIIRD